MIAVSIFAIFLSRAFISREKEAKISIYEYPCSAKCLKILK